MTVPKQATLDKTTECIDAAYPRRVPCGKGDRPLQLAVNCYTAGAQTGQALILAHANGFVKELYEPLLAGVFARVPIAVAYVVDAVNQGDSYRMQAEQLLDRYSWYDGAHDILRVVEHFRLKGPIAIVGHSMGGAMALYLAHTYPDLFSSVCALDPVIYPDKTHSTSPRVAALSARRRDYWESEQAFLQYVAQRPFFRAWDSRVIDKFREFGLVRQGGVARLKTPPRQECVGYLSYEWEEELGLEPLSSFLWTRVPLTRPHALVVTGERSDVWPPELVDAGRKVGMHITTLPQHGHLFPFEAVEATCSIVAENIVQGLQRGPRALHASIDSLLPGLGKL